MDIILDYGLVPSNSEGSEEQTSIRSHVIDSKFPIQGFQILVTSRFIFSRFGSNYELSLLSDKDARTLLCHSAFPYDGIPINVHDDLVTKMVKCCKGFPLALTVIG